MIRRDDEDIAVLHEVVGDLIENNERPVAVALAPHLHIIIKQYCNALHLSEVPEDGDHYKRAGSDKGIKQLGPKTGNDFAGD